MTRTFLVGIVVLAACNPPPPQKPVAKHDAPSTDVEESWVDPTTDLPVGVKRQTAERTLALANPDAPTIAIRGAKIMTATGNVIDGGTIVLQRGAITALGPDGSVTVPSGARVID